MSERDIIVATHNPEALDRTMNSLGAVVMQDEHGCYQQDGQGRYIVRVLQGDPGFVEFAIKSQGYGEVMGRGDAE